MFESDNNKFEREIKLSERIKSIPNYQDYFSPIEEICDARMSKISKEDKKDCKLIKEMNKKKYIIKMATLRFIE